MQIQITTQEREIYRAQACSIVATTANGEMKIFSGHAPLLAILRPGIVRIDCRPNCNCSEIKRDEMVIFGGFIEVQPDSVTILADSVERSDQIDANLAQQAVRQAREQFRTSPLGNTPVALLALEVAIARLSILKGRLGRS
ncbi:MAG: ATP synthase F1 subunit epsilon [Mariprofundales bacterium]